MSEDLRYPIGKFEFGPNVTSADRTRWIGEIEATPGKLRKAVSGLSAAQLDTPYRSGGWTVRQVVHHLADSHLNSYVRFKLAATENEPTIKGYDEARWAELEDARSGPIEVSIALLESLHQRWVVFLRSLTAEDFTRKFRHPELGPVTLQKNVALYSWHGRHHVAHIERLREREGWK